MNFFANLTSHLKLIPDISAAIQEIKAIGGSKETAVQKVGQIIQVSAAVGTDFPELPVVAAVSATVEEIAQLIFGAGAAPAPPTPATPTPASSTTSILD